jgi:hypothetical protein
MVSGESDSASLGIGVARGSESGRRSGSSVGDEGGRGALEWITGAGGDTPDGGVRPSAPKDTTGEFGWTRLRSRTLGLSPMRRAVAYTHGLADKIPLVLSRRGREYGSEFSCLTEFASGIPKGRDSKAQGNALGREDRRSTKP